MNTVFSNPVADMAAKADAAIAELDAEAVARMEEAATLDSADWVILGDKPSLALASGWIDADSAQALHVIHTNFDSGATLGERFVFLKFATEILGLLARG